MLNTLLNCVKLQGTVEYWDVDNAVWVRDGVLTSVSDTIEYTFNAGTIDTNAIRVIEIFTDPCGVNSNPTIYEWSVCAASTAVMFLFLFPTFRHRLALCDPLVVDSPKTPCAST